MAYVEIVLLCVTIAVLKAAQSNNVSEGWSN